MFAKPKTVRAKRIKAKCLVNRKPNWIQKSKNPLVFLPENRGKPNAKNGEEPQPQLSIPQPQPQPQPQPHTARYADRFFGAKTDVNTDLKNKATYIR